MKLAFKFRAALMAAAVLLAPVAALAQTVVVVPTVVVAKTVVDLGNGPTEFNSPKEIWGCLRRPVRVSVARRARPRP